MIARSLAAVVIGSALATSAATAQPAPARRPPIPAARLFPYLDRYWKLPAGERTLFAPAYMLKRDGAPARDLKLWLLDGGSREPIPIAADGRVERLPSAAQLQTGKLEVEAPPGSKLSLTLSFGLTLRPAPEMSAAELARAIRQANAGAHKAAGLMSALVPKLDRVVFHGAAGAQAVATGGGSTALPIAAGAPFADAALLARSTAIRFSRAPTFIEADEPAKR